MTLDDIKVFLTIAKSGSLTAAAQQLFLSQPALSKRLARFEDEMGTALFERGQGTRHLELTPSGKLFLPFAERWESLMQEMYLMHDLNSQVHFFVQATNTVGEYILPFANEAFSSLHPDVELVVGHNESRNCYGAVHDGVCDLAFVTQQHFFNDVITTPLWEESFYMLRQQCDAEPEGVVNPLTLKWQDEVMLVWNSKYLRWRQDTLAFVRHPVVTVANLQQAIPFIRKQHRWLIVPASVGHAALTQCPDLCLLKLTTPPPGRTVYAIEPAGKRHSCTEDLLRLVRDQVRAVEGVTML